jgi:hypothetical protein
MQAGWATLDADRWSLVCSGSAAAEFASLQNLRNIPRWVEEQFRVTGEATRCRRPLPTTIHLTGPTRRDGPSGAMIHRRCSSVVMKTNAVSASMRRTTTIFSGAETL